MTPRALLTEIAQALGTTEAALRGRYRGRQLSEARSVAVWLLRRISRERLSYPAIGALLGRDHSTVMYLARQGQDLADRAPYRDRVARLLIRKPVSHL